MSDEHRSRSMTKLRQWHRIHVSSLPPQLSEFAAVIALQMERLLLFFLPPDQGLKIIRQQPYRFPPLACPD